MKSNEEHKQGEHMGEGIGGRGVTGSLVERQINYL